MEPSQISIELAKIVASIAAPFAMFGTVVLILRWFKTDTADMMKIYSEATDKRIASVEKVVEAIKEDVTAIKDDVKDFHNRLIDLEVKRQR